MFTFKNTLGTAFCVGALAAAAGCGNTTTPATNGVGTTNEPVYLIQTAIYAPDETFNYTVLGHTLDFNIDLARLDTARQFPGYTGIEAIGGTVYAADGAAPFIRKYQVNDDLSWKELGKLNFSAYPMDTNNYMNFYFQSIKDDDSVYFYYGADKTSRVRWSMKDWKIVEALQDTKLPTPPAGWVLINTGNRTGIRDYKGAVVQAFTQYNEETDSNSDKSWLAVYDPTTHVEKDVLEVDCPGMQQSTHDEDGNMYFGTTFSFPTKKLYGKGPAPCVIKVKPDGTIDTSFAPNDMTAWTGGFYGVNFRYLGEGKAIANVLHHDRLGGTFTGDVEKAVVDKISDDPTVWELHLIDLAKGTSQVISDGFKPEHDLGWYTIYAQVDGRTFIIVQLDTEDTRSAVYELDVANAKVTFVANAEGDIWGVQRLR
jgi:hypothetical protein